MLISSNNIYIRKAVRFLSKQGQPWPCTKARQLRTNCKMVYYQNFFVGKKGKKVNMPFHSNSLCFFRKIMTFSFRTQLNLGGLEELMSFTR